MVRGWCLAENVMATIHDDIFTRFIVNVVMDLSVKLYRIESQCLKSSEIYCLVKTLG